MSGSLDVCLRLSFLFVSPSSWWCPALWLPLFNLLYLFPVIRLPFWLVVSCSLDVSLHLSPFICLPRCLVVSGSPDVFFVLSLFHLSHIVCLRGCVSQFFRLPCSPLSVFHHLSLTLCPVLHLSPESFVSNPMPALVAVSCSSFIIFYLCFMLLSFLYSLCVFLLSQDKIMFHHFFCVLPLVSHLSLTLSPSDCLRYKCRGKIESVWHEKNACDSCSSQMTWIKNCQHQELV